MFLEAVRSQHAYQRPLYNKSFKLSLQKTWPDFFIYYIRQKPEEDAMMAIYTK